MGMKPVAVFILVAVLSIATVAATAKTVTTSRRSPNEQAVIGVAGPPPARKVTDMRDKYSAQPSKKTLKKVKITPPPPMHDPN
jgi:maltose-binding protein MalE